MWLRVFRAAGKVKNLRTCVWVQTRFTDVYSLGGDVRASHIITGSDLRAPGY